MPEKDDENVQIKMPSEPVILPSSQFIFNSGSLEKQKRNKYQIITDK
uniref:Uncharacterized protein n=1 Tax=Tetranychus urticae TaxID=32264 RepID=T1JRQ0_TETUR